MPSAINSVLSPARYLALSRVADGSLTPQDLLGEIDAFQAALATMASRLDALRQKVEEPLAARQRESARRHELLARYCERMRGQGLDLYNPKSKSGFAISRIGKLVGLANVDVRN
jgi:hypothetical protein